ncbi:2'-5' RNA ligase family protein [Segetibacter aerophilus]|uniref:2'-5' RNA ligase n=1 Tax=Segetibacter aerophilus TaxID=670293 RepID=A0A512B7N8_9BACT|nr:2'-5' RNA ligase family protein [Segetibacter aerophilus]GEO07974.1 2'-5' RNA ligase [Segetibacter aerophilus]
MKHFIGLVPPDDICETVVNIQKQFGDNRLEPHITLQPPVTVLNETAWLDAIENTCNSFQPFPISLPGTGNFGTRVLFISVQSAPLTTLHSALIPAIQPYEQADNRQQQNQSFHPHLTLGRGWCGFTRQDFAAMKILADEYLTKEPVAFEATFLRIYFKRSGQGRYEKMKDVYFKGDV